MLTIWGRLNSHNVRKVAWAAEEIGLPYVRHDVGLQFGMDDAYLARNPNALVPTIEDEGLVLWESNAILRYLAARYAPALWLDDPAVRAQGDKWMDWQFAYADAQREAFVNLIRRPVERRDPEAIARSAKASAAMMALVDAELARIPWLSGEAFGLGDIPMGVYAHTWFTLDIERPAMARVEEWYRRLQTRAGYAGQVMIPLICPPCSCVSGSMAPQNLPQRYPLAPAFAGAPKKGRAIACTAVSIDQEYIVTRAHPRARP